LESKAKYQENRGVNRSPYPCNLRHPRLKNLRCAIVDLYLRFPDGATLPGAALQGICVLRSTSMKMKWSCGGAQITPKERRVSKLPGLKRVSGGAGSVNGLPSRSAAKAGDQ
jgi:hypothetical protein